MSCVPHIACWPRGKWLSVLALLVFCPADGWTQSSVQPQAPDGYVRRAPKKPGGPATPGPKRLSSRSLLQSASASLWLQTATVDWNSLTDRALARTMDAALRTTPQVVTTAVTINPGNSIEFDNRRAMYEVYQSQPIERKADYKLNRSAVIGAASKYQEDDPRTSLSQSTDQALAAYFAVKASPAFNVDLRAEHGEQTTALAGQNAWGSKDAASAKVSGALDFWQFKFAPTVSVKTEAERHANGFAKEETSEKVSVELAPRLSRPLDLSSGQKIEPFVMLKRRMEAGTTSQGTPVDQSLSQSVGGGVTLAQPNAYSLSVTTEMERSSETAPADVKSRLQLNIPLK